MTTPFTTKYTRCQQTINLIRNALVAVKGDLGDLSSYFKGNPSLLESDLSHLVQRMDELAIYAHEVQTAVREKREAGKEADERIEILIGAVN